VLWAGLPGQEAGNSIADVLYGDWNPSGKLPYTIAKRPEDYPAQLALGATPGQTLEIPYSEGSVFCFRMHESLLSRPFVYFQVRNRLPAL
jgi:beta-glucosidase